METNKRYVLRVYDRSLPYDDDIYRSEGNNDKIEVQFEADTVREILDIWLDNTEEYEGSTYCIKDMQTGNLLVGGAWDPDDDVIIKEHLPFEENDELNPVVAVIRNGSIEIVKARTVTIKKGDTFFVDGEPYLACEDADVEHEFVFSADDGFSTLCGESFVFGDLDGDAPKNAEKKLWEFALTRIATSGKEGIVLSFMQLEAAYRYAEHRYHMEDADRQLMRFIFGAAFSDIDDYADYICCRDELDEDEKERLAKFKSDYGLSVEEAYALREQFVERYEKNFNCNEAINAIWENSIAEVLVENRHFGKDEPAVAESEWELVHISEIEEGDVILFDGHEYTATSDAYTTITDNGREWNVEIEGNGAESYIYASYFPNGEVPVEQK